jgi:hypothetical protein
MTQPLQPDAVETPPAEPPPDADQSGIRSPTKLIRIASMTRAMLEEVRQMPLDEGGRTRLAEVLKASEDELRDMLSPDLLEEFNEVFVPVDREDATPAELRIAQAQLIGWLEGLFHGIQASLFSQQMAAQAQLAQMQHGQLGPGGPEPDSPGQYL